VNDLETLFPDFTTSKFLIVYSGPKRSTTQFPIVYSGPKRRGMVWFVLSCEWRHCLPR